jgi:hypothetical protein
VSLFLYRRYSQLIDDSTNQLRLEWSFLASQYPTTLRIDPRWDTRHPEIGFQYETTLATTDQLIPIEISIPEGWAWKSFDIQGPQLRSFRSTDVEGWYTTSHPHEAEEEVEVEDSFSTLRNRPGSKRPLLASRSSSLMKQSLPDVRIDEFSFEVNHDDSLETVSPGQGHGHASPSVLMSSTRSERQSVVPDYPTPGRLFDLIFDDHDHGDSPQEGRSFAVEGTLVPLPHTLVSGSLPVEIPFLKSGECQISCLNSTLPDDGICNTSTSSIGQFNWVDAYDQPVPSNVVGVKGDIRVRLNRDGWGTMRMGIIFPYPKRVSEVVFNLKSGRVNISKAEVDNQAIRRCITSIEGGHEIRLMSDVSGMAEIGIDLGTSGEICLPHFKNAEGTMILELRGTGWDSKSLPHSQ